MPVALENALSHVQLEPLMSPLLLPNSDFLSLKRCDSIYTHTHIWDGFNLHFTPFLSRRFMRNPTDKNKTLLSITTLNKYLINSLLIKYFFCLFFSLLIKSFFPFSLQFLQQIIPEYHFIVDLCLFFSLLDSMFSKLMKKTK